MKKVKDIMNMEIISVTEDDSFENVLKIMKEKGIGEIPVITDGNVVGVVTRDDMLVKQGVAPTPPVVAFWDLLITLPQNKEFVSKLSKLSGYRVSEIMSREYLKIECEEELEFAVTKILEDSKGFALAFSNGELKGIVTKTDLINKAF